MMKTKVIQVRKLSSHYPVIEGDHLRSLCGTFPTYTINKQWAKYWRNTNTDYKLIMTDYFYLDKVDPNMIYLLRLLLLNDFCKQYGYELIY